MVSEIDRRRVLFGGAAGLTSAPIYVQAQTGTDAPSGASVQYVGPSNVAPLRAITRLGADYSAASEDLVKFRFWHVEPLLNQSADLLDRCLRERSDYNSLRAQWETLRLSLEGAQRDYDLNVKSTDLSDSAQQQTLEQQRIGYSDVDGVLVKALDLVASYITKPWDTNGIGMSATDSINVQWDGLRAQEGAARMNMLIAEKSLMIQKIQQEYNQTRFKNAKNALDARIELMKGDGALNFQRQADIILARINSDLRDAFDRLSVAATGLALLYDYHTPLPVFASSDSPLDDAVKWVRDCIRWLVAFGQLDQGFTKVISVRELAGESAWQDGLSQSVTAGQATFSFRLPPDLFAGHSYVRLRGVSGFVRGPTRADGVWSADLSLPEQAIVSLGGGKISAVDQRQLPICKLGRLSAIDSPRSPEVAGMISLLNASPIGSPKSEGVYRINTRPSVGGTAQIQKLSDIWLELQFVGQPG